MPPKRISIAVPEAVRQQLGENCGRTAAQIIHAQLASPLHDGFGPRAPAWDAVLGPERPHKFYQPVRKPRRILVLRSAPAQTGPLEPMPENSQSLPEPGPLGSAILELAKYDELVALRMAPFEYLQRYYDRVREIVPNLFDDLARTLRTAESVLLKIAGISIQGTEDFFRPALQLAESVSRGARANPLDVHQTARLFTQLGLVYPHPVGTLVSTLSPEYCRISVPTDQVLRAQLLSIAAKTRLSVSIIGCTALLANHLEFPFKELIERVVLRRPVLETAKLLAALHAVLLDFDISIQAGRDGADPGLAYFLHEVMQQSKGLKQDRKRVLRLAIGVLAGKAEIHISSLLTRSAKLQPFCEAASSAPEAARSDLLRPAAAMVQRLWGENTNYQSIYRLIRSANWADLSKLHPY